jgi:hypothetical protein
MYSYYMLNFISRIIGSRQFHSSYNHHTQFRVSSVHANFHSAYYQQMLNFNPRIRLSPQNLNIWNETFFFPAFKGIILQKMSESE